MKLYAIKMPDGTYFAQNANQYDNTFRFTDDIKKSQKYVSIVGLEKAISMCKEIFKGGVIIDLDTKEIVKYIRCYDKKLEGIKVLKETQKAIMLDTGEWLPKSQCEVVEDNVYISGWLWVTRFENKDCEVV